jgi:exopolyphosphatase/guanosine-5'-triphosphate,3'-diphosphate pyrophosphatase
MAVLAAVDIGANSVRLKIARLRHSRLEVVHEDREVTRLGESVFSGGTLLPDAMAHTIKVLRRFHRATQKYGAEAVRAVATSALRDSRNAQAFVDWVRSATGWKLEIISGLEEGRLIHLGVVSNIRLKATRMLLIDLGGGSCELTLSQGEHIREISSLPLGAVRLTQEFLQHDPPRPGEIERLRGYISEEIAHVAPRLASARVNTAIATSGTAAALAAYAQSKWRRRGGVSRAAALKMAEDLARRTVQQRALLPGIGPRRAEIIVAGAFVYSELMERLQLPTFCYSPLGLRDGVLAQMAAERGAALQRRIVTERWDALLAAGQRYNVDLDYARHVRMLAMELFRVLRNIHQLPPDFEEWLSAAAMLHEVGEYVNRAGRHRHAYYLIANSEIFGYTPVQRLLIAAIARYMGKSRPAVEDRILKRLPSSARLQLPEAVVLLRLARALNQGRQRSVRGVRARIDKTQVRLSLKRSRSAADLELWALKKERAYFREVFGRDLVASVT